MYSGDGKILEVRHAPAFGAAAHATPGEDET
jgi:hypothetical protein